MEKYFCIYLFLLTIQQALAIDECGGNITATKFASIVTSPNYPEPHGHNLLCSWSLQSHNEVNIILTITNLDTEACCDHLDVFDGELQIGHFSGKSDRHVSLISSSSSLRLVFLSDGSISNAGFRATFKEVNNCGYPLLANKTKAYFSTPFYPNSHPPNLDCFWPIHAKDQLQKVEVTIEEGKTNACCDFVEIFDGSSVLGKIKGNITKQMKFSSSEQRLGVYFHSAALASRDGFLASYREFECGGTYQLLGETMKEFSSPNYPKSSAHYLDCEYTFQAETGYRVELSLEVNTEECCDYLDLYEGKKYLGQLKGSIPKSSVVSLGQSIKVHFHTDGSINSKGFRGTYRQVLPSCGKTIQVKKLHQVLPSPGYPEFYPNDYNCNWILTAPASYKIALQVKDFATEACCDYLEIFDGLVSIGRLQGTITTPITIVSKTSRLVLRFYTDDTTQSKGFMTTYKLAKNCGSSSFATPIAQSFSTPGYPNDYPDNLDCMWIIQSRDHTQVQLNISSGETEAIHDFVQILDDLQPIVQLQGWWPDRREFVSNSSTMRVYFHTDKSATRDGFTVSYKEVCDYAYKVTSYEDAFLTSPNYPNHTPHDYECNYQLTAPEGQRISLNVLDARTEECCDYIAIIEEEREITVLRGENITTPLTINSNSTQMKILYHTDSTIPSVGFQISYKLLQDD